MTVVVDVDDALGGQRRLRRTNAPTSSVSVVVAVMRARGQRVVVVVVSGSGER